MVAKMITLKVNRNRTYRNSGSHRLITWSQDRCVDCKRFLASRHGSGFRCIKCSNKHSAKQSIQKHKELYHNNQCVREEHALRTLVRRHPERFEVGDYV